MSQRELKLVWVNEDLVASNQDARKPKKQDTRDESKDDHATPFLSRYKRELVGAVFGVVGAILLGLLVFVFNLYSENSENRIAEKIKTNADFRTGIAKEVVGTSEFQEMKSGVDKLIKTTDGMDRRLKTLEWRALGPLAKAAGISNPTFASVPAKPAETVPINFGEQNGISAEVVLTLKRITGRKFTFDVEPKIYWRGVLQEPRNTPKEFTTELGELTTLHIEIVGENVPIRLRLLPLQIAVIDRTDAQLVVASELIRNPVS